MIWQLKAGYSENDHCSLGPDVKTFRARRGLKSLKRCLQGMRNGLPTVT